MSFGNVVRTHAPSPRTTVVLTAVAIVLTSLLHAQTPQTPAAPAAREAAAANRLPVRRVVLYKSGVGYFEHMGRVRGNQSVTVDFTSGQLDDVLKSLTTIDLDGGRVLGINYNSDAGLDRRLAALRLPIGQQATRAQLLNAIRGAKVEVRTGASVITGRLLSVEQTQREAGNNSIITTDTVSLVTDGGEIQTVALNPGVSVRIADADLNREVSQYLSVVASARDQDVRRVTISTAGTGDRDLFVSYISEVPVWKPTYRLVLPTAAAPRKPLLQGWAIIDNTVGEDWENVELSLVAGAPQSFVQQISRPLYVQRPVVPLPQRMSLSPQTHQSAMSVAGAGAISGTVTDRSGSVIPGVTVRVVQAGAVISTVVTDRTGRFQVPGLQPGSYDVNISLAGFKTVNHVGVAVSGGMETVTNATLEIGALSETVEVRGSTVSGLPQSSRNITLDGVANGTVGGIVGGIAGGGGGGGRGGGRGGSPNAAPIEAPALLSPDAVFRASQQSDASGGQLGDLFEYKLKQAVTIRKNQSALVPILSGDVDAEKVSLWNASSGSSRPLRAVWMTNATGLTLDGGSFSVIDGQAFAGEGLMDPLKPGEKRLLSYAIDLGVQVDTKGESVPIRITRVQVNRGFVIQTTEERTKRTYSARNEDTEPRVLIIEHPVRNGWTVGGTVSPSETTPAWYRYRVPVEPKKTAMIVIDEVRPGQTQYAVSNITDDQVAMLVQNELITPALESSFRQILAQKAKVADLTTQIQAKDREIQQISSDQDRVRENMKSLKGSSEEKQLLQRYVKQLQDQEDRIEALRRDLQKLSDDRQAAQAELTRMVETLVG